MEQLTETDRNVYISGSGGVGKTVLLNKYIKHCEKYGVKVGKAAYTGTAALNIGGSTLHSFFGVGLGTGPPEKILNKVRSRADVKERIQTVEVLIIDEVSMLGCNFFELLDFVARGIRRDPLTPFGGIRIVCSGDMLQLPPINDEWIFKSEVWKELNFMNIELTKPYRFTDTSFWETLNRIRVGEPSEDDIKKLYAKVKDYKKYVLSKKDAIKPTIIHSHRKDVNEINMMNLERLTTQKATYRAVDMYEDGIVPNDHYDDALEYAAPKTLVLKVDAQVMLTKNLSLEDGLCNGSRGVVTKLDEDTVTVLFLNGTTLAIEIYPMEVEIYGHKITRSQIPLILAYALTIHKVQGATIDFAVLNLGSSIFCAGQAYVALSRVRCWDGLLLTSFLPESIMTDKDALKFTKSLKNSSSTSASTKK